jgi:hypothetical protein
MSAYTPPDDIHLVHALQHACGHVVGLHAIPDARPWSRTYRVELRTGDMLYLKGTPRDRPEAVTTAFLSTCCPTYLPHVVHTDLIPESAWRWFLTTDAGCCTHTELPLHVAAHAAFALGRIQQQVVHTDPSLARILPTCLPHQLHQIALTSCDWLIQQGYPAVEAYRTQIARATPYFATLAQQLAVLPATCVHGDFWPGNIAVQRNMIKVIDWGEAVWGIGGASIWNLLLTSRDTLAHHTAAIWTAYAHGWGRDIPEDYITASQMAFTITMLVVDYGYARWHPAEVDIGPGMLTTVQQVVRQLD